MTTSEWFVELVFSAAAMEMADKNPEEYKQAEARYAVAFNRLLSRGYKSSYLLKQSGMQIPPQIK